jgi:hypothetical protein
VIDLTDYETAGVALLRARYPIETATLSDAGICAAYSWWSEEIHCAGWLMLGNYEADEFAAYAFRNPCAPIEVA